MKQEPVSTNDLEYVSPEKLHLWLTDKNKRVAVVDVRDDDFAGGHIKGCLHYPSSSLPEKLPELLPKLADYDEVVFHCALSQVRGPQAALRTLRSAAALPPQEFVPLEPVNILVLRGGFTEWQRLYGEDATTEAYAKDIWREY